MTAEDIIDRLCEPHPSLPIIQEHPVGAPSAPAPELSSILYVHPNRDGTRKNCKNCMMWVKKTEQCVIHNPKLEVVAEEVCGYHIFGKPMSKWMDHPGIDYVDPKFSGLEDVVEGTACDNCHFFERGTTSQGESFMGLCLAARDSEIPTMNASVHGRGCCARWEAIESSPMGSEFA